MPRKACIDAPGALHHIIIRGIERKAIFKDSADRELFFEREVARYYKIEPENLISASKERPVTKARRVLCYIAVRKLRYKCTDVSKTGDIRAVTVSKAVTLGSKLSEIAKIQKQILGK